MLVVEIWEDDSGKSKQIYELTAVNRGRKASVKGGVSYQGNVTYETHRKTFFDHDNAEMGALELARKLISLEISRDKREARESSA